MDPKQRPIALLSPPGEFYAYLLNGFAQGFLAHGYQCSVRNEQVDQHRLAEWARTYQPHAVLEINRALANDVDWPSGIPHFAWIQDRRILGQDFERGDFGKSDYLYFILLPEIFDLEVPEGRSWSLLLPGARTDALPPQNLPYRIDFVMIGYIGPPVFEGSIVAHMPDGRSVSFGEFWRAFPVDVLRQSDFSLRRVRAAVDDTCRRLGCRLAPWDELPLIFEEYLPRSLERRRVVEGMLSVSTSLEIYSQANWLRYPQFAPYYKGFIADPRVFDVIYQTTRVNVHNGELLMHFRVLDCMAANGFILINTTKFDDRPGGIHNYFEPDRHYGAYPIDDVAPVARRYLADEPARIRIAAEARREVMAHHTWVNRAAQILRDLGLPL